MKKKSKTSDSRDTSISIGSKKGELPLNEISEILDIPEEELKKLSDPLIKKIVEIGIKEESYFLGPLPPPSLVSEYEKVLPGSFDRILKMTEKNAEHRIEIDRHEIEMEREVVPETIKMRKSGQNKAFIITILGFIAVLLCAYMDQVTIGSVLAGTTLISLVPNFISGIKKNKTNKIQEKE